MHKQLRKQHQRPYYNHMYVPISTNTNTSSWARASLGSRNSQRSSNNISSSDIISITTRCNPLPMSNGSSGRSPTKTNICKSTPSTSTTN
jgi:hypothetical protein